MAAFSKIGLHLDLRIQVPPLPAFRRIAREARELGVNTLIVEWEASFPFDRNAVISGPHAYTTDEVRSFLRECEDLGLDVIPLQQCFGHVEYILRHERYASLRESESDLCQVCPCRSAEAAAVFIDIFREIIEMHESPYFHIGGDETYLLGDCPTCRKQVETHGKSGLYVNYLRQLAEVVIGLGKRPLLWVDMLLKYPEAAAQMPRECVFVDWNYGWPLDRFGDFSGLSALPFEFWGAVAMRSAPDNHSSHAWVAHLENLRQYIPVARAMKFQGIIMTSWSTSGVYGYEWEMLGRPLALYPLRRATPHAGLRIMMEAFAEAVRQDEALDKEKFLSSYARRRFGFDEDESALFRDALLLSDRSEGWESLRSDPAGDIRRAQACLRGLKPSRNQREFARYRLMVNFTEYHGRVAAAEAKMQSSGYTLEIRSALGNEALELLREGEDMDKEYLKLYEGELHAGEFREESRYRLKRIRNLVEKTCGRSASSESARGDEAARAGEKVRFEPRSETPELAGRAA